MSGPPHDSILDDISTTRPNIELCQALDIAASSPFIFISSFHKKEIICICTWKGDFDISPVHEGHFRVGEEPQH